MLDYLRHMFDLAFDGAKQGVIFFMLLYSGIVCLFSLAYVLRVRGWPWVEGVLHAHGTRQIGAGNVPSQRHRIAFAHYSYRVDGIAYEGRRVSPWQFSASGVAAGLPGLQAGMIRAQGTGGDRVRVYYDPRRPRRAYVLRPGWPGIVFLALAIVVPPLLFAWSYHG